jgi:hypothetical protein
MKDKKDNVKKLIEDMITRVFGGAVPETVIRPLVDKIDAVYSVVKEEKKSTRK